MTTRQTKIFKNVLDTESDNLIRIIVNTDNKIECNKASKKLFELHNSYIDSNIYKYVVDQSARQDIAQDVWIYVLDVQRLSNLYQYRGKFRAYLHKPIRWAIQAHIRSLPNVLDRSTKTRKIITEQSLEDEHIIPKAEIDQYLMDLVINDIVKPGLKDLDVKTRNVYMLSEYQTLFTEDPDLVETAQINDTDLSTAKVLLTSATSKDPSQCNPEELSIYIPIKYNYFIDLKMVSGSLMRYLSGKIGFDELQYRKRLSKARKYFVILVRHNLPESFGNQQ